MNYQAIYMTILVDNFLTLLEDYVEEKKISQNMFNKMTLFKTWHNIIPSVNFTNTQDP